MAETFRTSEIAALIGVHPNTVRLYEELELIPKPERLPNGYRVFTDFHLQQLRLVRLAFEIEVLQNGLRKKMIRMVKTAAERDFDSAITLIREYPSDRSGTPWSGRGNPYYETDFIRHRTKRCFFTLSEKT